MKRRIAVISIILIVALAGSAFADGIGDIMGEITGALTGIFSDGDTDTSEAAKTPEDAAAKLIAGLQNNNIDQVMNAFAIDVFAENMNAEAFYDRMKMASAMGGWAPADVPFAYEINKVNRMYNVLSQIRSLYNTLIENAAFYGEESGKSITMGDVTVSEFMDSVYPIQNADMTIVFNGEFVAPDTLSKGAYAAERNQETMWKQAEWTGCDEVQSVVAKFECNSTQYYLFLDVMRYGENWYVYNAIGNCGTLLGLSTYTGGVVKVEDLQGLMN